MADVHTYVWKQVFQYSFADFLAASGLKVIATTQTNAARLVFMTLWWYFTAYLVKGYRSHIISAATVLMGWLHGEWTKTRFIITFLVVISHGVTNELLRKGILSSTIFSSITLMVISLTKLNRQSADRLNVARTFTLIYAKIFCDNLLNEQKVSVLFFSGLSVVMRFVYLLSPMLNDTMEIGISKNDKTGKTVEIGISKNNENEA
ncbi:hypothetical protein HHK36_010307 [Tetracentron sinense]|uniref:Uncharacterized protein n=1 Tax=Tetracentron sinense TaxID=13715 RepID=A0A834ZEM9_TETSI|nr:hypothetical protein HHK36_010307 [Tetracentron sinense]